ncbi:hypothetical protein [uncultured Nonlabens sp.]|uniref:hypothetical protein n=1 Tax=uncultured Nonlabens sp. TaxID=859306 RepID=UPI0030DC2FB1|tara:strand:+ start:28896 stop:29231 length:336 start_codon:yes stop_codon:yes gene_type:complete
MGHERNNLYDGIFYRMEQLGVYIAKAPLYVKNERALEVCFEKMKNEFCYLRDHLRIQNIQDWNQVKNTIDEAIERDANHSPKYRILGERIEQKDTNGITCFSYTFQLYILE